MRARARVCVRVRVCACARVRVCGCVGEAKKDPKERGASAELEILCVNVNVCVCVCLCVCLCVLCVLCVHEQAPRYCWYCWRVRQVYCKHTPSGHAVLRTHSIGDGHGLGRHGVVIRPPTPKSFTKSMLHSKARTHNTNSITPSYIRASFTRL